MASQAVIPAAMALAIRARSTGLMQFPPGTHAELLGEYAERQAAQRAILGVAGFAAIAILFLLQTAFGNFRRAVECGGAGEVSQVSAAMRACRDLVGLRRFLLVGDSKLVSYANLADMIAAGVEFIAPASEDLRARRRAGRARSRHGYRGGLRRRARRRGRLRREA